VLVGAGTGGADLGESFCSAIAKQQRPYSRPT
jgi:hypothetical protein